MKKYILLTSLSFLMFACGASSPYTGTTTNGASGAGGTTPTPTPPDNSAWNNFNFTATITGGSSSNFLSVTIDKIKKTITLSLPLPFDSSIAGILEKATIPAINGASISFGQLPDLTPVLTVTLPLSAIANGVTGLPTSSLPNGDPIPGMPANAEPSTQVTVGNGKIPVYVYVGQMSIGLFVNTPFDPTISTHFQLTDNDGNSAGGLYSIPYKAPNKDGGFFLNVNVPSQFTKLILSNL